MNHPLSSPLAPVASGENRSLRLPSISATAWVVAAFVLLDFAVVGDAIWFEKLTGLLARLQWTRLEDVLGSTSIGCADPLTLALASSQAGLLVLWALLGSHRWPLRWLGAAAGTSLWVAVLAAIPTRVYKPVLTELFFAAQAIAIIVLVLVVRFIGYRIRKTGDNPPAPPHIRRPQFRLADMFLGLAALGVLCALLPDLNLGNTYFTLASVSRGSLHWGRLPDAGETFSWLLVHGAGCGLLAALAVWSVLGRGPFGPRLAVLLVASWAFSRLVIKSYFNYQIYTNLWTGYRLHASTPYVIWRCLHVAMVTVGLTAARATSLQMTRRVAGADQGARCIRPDHDSSTRRSWLKASAFALVAWGLVRGENTTARLFCDHEHRRTVDTTHELGVGLDRSFRMAGSPIPLCAFIGRRLEPQDFKRLRGLSKVEGLFFLEDGLGPEVWDQLRKMPQLRFVMIQDGATDDGVERLAKLHSVEFIQLTGPDITDAGLAHLRALPKLRWLQLNNTPHVTPAGLAPLKQARPRATIFRLN